MKTCATCVHFIHKTPNYGECDAPLPASLAEREPVRMPMATRDGRGCGCWTDRADEKRRRLPVTVQYGDRVKTATKLLCGDTRQKTVTTLSAGSEGVAREAVGSDDCRRVEFDAGPCLLMPVSYLAVVK